MPAKQDTATSQTLVIDIGGTGLKMIVLDEAGHPINERARELTPKPATPEGVTAVLEGMISSQPAHARVSVGFPGVVQRGVVRTAPNLGTEAWAGFPLAHRIGELTGKPTRAVNDADLQGFGVITGEGTELVLTLGTGLGSAVFADGRLVPNLELAHQAWRKGDTYEERVSNEARKRKGNSDWSERVHRMLADLAPIWNYDRLHLGGGNAKHLEGDLPDCVRLFSNVEGMTGGARLWHEGLDAKGASQGDPAGNL
ncbi:MAG: ROK family protein [Pseudomonadota bacterium]